MVAYLGYTLRMKTLFRGWPVMANDTHTRRRRLGFMVRKTVQSERHTKFVDLLEFGGLQTPKTPCYGPANSNVNELVMVQLRPLQ